MIQRHSAAGSVDLFVICIEYSGSKHPYVIIAGWRHQRARPVLFEEIRVKESVEVPEHGAGSHVMSVYDAIRVFNAPVAFIHEQRTARAVITLEVPVEIIEVVCASYHRMIYVSAVYDEPANCVRIDPEESCKVLKLRPAPFRLEKQHPICKLSSGEQDKKQHDRQKYAVDTVVYPFPDPQASVQFSV